MEINYNITEVLELSVISSHTYVMFNPNYLLFPGREREVYFTPQNIIGKGSIKKNLEFFRFSELVGLKNPTHHTVHCVGCDIVCGSGGSHCKSS